MRNKLVIAYFFIYITKILQKIKKNITIIAAIEKKRKV